MFKTIEGIRNHDWAGNAHSDMDAFFGIDAFVMNPNNSVEDKCEALNIMSTAGMGEDWDDQPAEVQVKEYVDNR